MSYFDVFLMIILVIILVAKLHGFGSYNVINIHSFDYHVLDKYKNTEGEAAKRLSNVYEKILKFLQHERIKYRVGLTTEEISKLGPGPNPMIAGHDAKSIVENMIYNFNPEKIYENDPNNLTGSTSYTVQKGREMYLCIRNKDGSFVDDNTLMFVVLHELSHIGAYWTVGHTPDFWTVFAFVLKDAIETGIYSYVDYSKEPVKYCGMTITTSPYRP